MEGLMKVITDYVNSGTVHYVLEGLGLIANSGLVNTAHY